MQTKQIDKIRKTLELVIDPETHQNVMKMNMVKNLRLEGCHCYIEFEPTSPICPLAFKLSRSIVLAIREVEGVENISIKVLNHIHSKKIEELFNI